MNFVLNLTIFFSIALCYFFNLFFIFLMSKRFFFFFLICYVMFALNPTSQRIHTLFQIIFLVSVSFFKQTKWIKEKKL
jgi:hypothetical protein